MNKIKAIIFCCLLSSSVLSQQKPNIIYIYADDLGYGELGSYGQMKIKTPNLDRMAKEGMRFTQHYSSSAVCAPARCMLMTGKHAGSSYIRGNYELGGFLDSEEKGQIPLKAEEFTVAELVKQKGYTTALVGKWGLGMNGTEGSPNAQGFDYYYGYLDQKQSHNYYPTHLWENEKWDTLNQPYINVHKILDPKTATDTDFDYFKGEVYAPEKMTEKALKFIYNNKENPFFLYLPYTIPHASLQAPEEWIKQYIGLFEEKPYYGQNGYASTKYPLSTYAAMISYLDAQVGIIMARIKELGLDENTIIMFSSDNGTTFNGGVDAAFFNSVDNLKGLKMDLYEGGIREPFIARWPGKIRAGSISDLISAQYDFFATIADLTNQKVKNTDGISFLPELLGNKSKQKKHDYLYFEYPEKGGQIAIRTGDWKGVKSNLKKNPNALWEIYNLRSDRNETVDVSNQNSKLVKRFEEILKKEHQTSAVKNWEFINTRNSKL
ncbi:arylsulfatase [Flavobacterium sp. XN-5]|uniref:arylsulfatase n=1 Tax=Flavobacterium sp. XN-5 TaxID=2599390 RepID=UPI0011C8542B|nr:arylsulfatase [Flavobacterium sp. XN-5]NGY36095.1 arylsulfatase [Flavobacterium sp. XN-5]